MRGTVCAVLLCMVPNAGERVRLLRAGFCSFYSSFSYSILFVTSHVLLLLLYHRKRGLELQRIEPPIHRAQRAPPAAFSSASISASEGARKMRAKYSSADLLLSYLPARRFWPSLENMSQAELNTPVNCYVPQCRRRKCRFCAELRW